MPLSIKNLSATACRNSGIPELGVYLVNPASRAAIAAALMCSGVSKSGSPAPKLQMSIPSAFIALSLLSMERETEGVRLVALAESCIKRISTSIWRCPGFQPISADGKELGVWSQDLVGRSDRAPNDILAPTFLFLALFSSRGSLAIFLCVDDFESCHEGREEFLQPYLPDRKESLTESEIPMALARSRFGVPHFGRALHKGSLRRCRSASSIGTVERPRLRN